MQWGQSHLPRVTRLLSRCFLFSFSAVSTFFTKIFSMMICSVVMDLSLCHDGQSAPGTPSQRYRKLRRSRYGGVDGLPESVRHHRKIAPGEISKNWCVSTGIILHWHNVFILWTCIFLMPAWQTSVFVLIHFRPDCVYLNVYFTQINVDLSVYILKMSQ